MSTDTRRDVAAENLETERGVLKALRGVPMYGPDKDGFWLMRRADVVPAVAALLREPSEAREPDAWAGQWFDDEHEKWRVRGYGKTEGDADLLFINAPDDLRTRTVPVYFGVSPKEPEGDEWQGLDARVDYCRWQGGLDRYCLRPAGHDDDHRFGPRPDGWPKHRATPPEEASEGDVWVDWTGDMAAWVAAQSQETEYTEKLPGPCIGERCSMCGEQAVTKVEQDTFGEPYHGLSAYLCGEHFGAVMSYRGYRAWLAPHGTEGARRPDART